MSEQYTIEDFLDGYIYVRCDNEEEQEQLKMMMAGYEPVGDALCGRVKSAALFSHHRDQYDKENARYGWTSWSRVHSPCYDLPIVPLRDLGEANVQGVQFDSELFMTMLGCGGE